MDGTDQCFVALVGISGRAKGNRSVRPETLNPKHPPQAHLFDSHSTIFTSDNKKPGHPTLDCACR